MLTFRRPHSIWITFLVVTCLGVSIHADDVTERWISAVERSDLEELAQLLRGGFQDVDVRDTIGRTALMAVARRSNVVLARRLLERGASVSTVNDNGGTPLMHAAVGGVKELVLELLIVGADVNAMAGTGWTALTLAAVKGHKEIVVLLLGWGARLNDTDIYGWSNLMHAVEQRRAEVVAVLLKTKGIDVNARSVDGVTALHRAAALGLSDIAALLLANGADPTITDPRGRTAADYAQGAGFDLRMVSPSGS